MGLQVVTNFHPPMRANGTATAMFPCFFEDYKSQVEAIDYLRKAWFKTEPGASGHTTVKGRALCTGLCAVINRNEETTEAIRIAGGLLLIGGAA